MAETFHFSSAQELLGRADELHFPMPYHENAAGILGQPLNIYGRQVSNRLVAQPIEGFDAQADGSPSPRSVERYCQLVRGGFRTLWLESVSVDEQGRSNPFQLWLHLSNLEAFRDMVKTIRAQTEEQVFLVIQLTHSGRNSNPNGKARPVCAFSNPCIPKENEYILPDEEIQEIEEDYVRACILAQEVGFDAVDIRTCHGYLLNEFLAAYNRPGRYGGSYENRTRFLMEILDKLKDTVTIPIGVRLNMYDGLPWPYGWGADAQGENLTESYRLVSDLYAKGIRLLNITNGIGAYSPFVIRPYDRGGIDPTESPFQGIYRMQQCAKHVKELAPDAVVIASGFSWLREFAPQVAAGGIAADYYDMAGFGRQSIRLPDTAEKILTGQGLQRKECCVTCCGCTNLIKKSGKMLRCIMKDRE